MSDSERLRATPSDSERLRAPPHHDIRQARLSANHPTTSLSNLATILYDQDHLPTARGPHERALAIRKTRPGADHPDTGRSREALAAVVAELDNRQ